MHPNIGMRIIFYGEDSNKTRKDLVMRKVISKLMVRGLTFNFEMTSAKAFPVIDPLVRMVLSPEIQAYDAGRC